MSNEINTTLGGRTIAPGTQNTREAGQNQGQATVGNHSTGSTAQSSTVSMTQLAEKLLALETKLAEMPVVDSVRVAEIKQSIADGSFTINPANIASKLLSMESGLLKGDG